MTKWPELLVSFARMCWKRSKA